MRIIEQFTKGKVSDEKNEDRIVVTDDFIAVVDGATSQVKTLDGGKTPGALAADMVAEAIRQLPSEADMPAAAAFITSHFKKTESKPTASAAIYSRHHNQVWLIGDCQCIANDTLYTNTKKIDTLMAESRAAFIHAALLGGETVESFLTNDIGRDFIKPFLKRQPIFQNNPDAGEYAFSVIDGNPILLNKVRTINATSNLVILATDGYPRLFPTLKQSEEYLKGIIDKDPLCINENRATKGVYTGQSSFDDRALISFEAQLDSFAT